MTKPITATMLPESQAKIFDALPRGQQTNANRLEYLNRPIPCAHAQICGILKGWTTPSQIAFKRVIKAELEVQDRYEVLDTGELPAKAIFTLFCCRAAYHILKASRKGDVILAQHAVFTFFAPVKIDEHDFANGWIAYTAMNLSAQNTHRFEEGTAKDFHYKEERKQEQTGDELILKGDVTPW